MKLFRVLLSSIMTFGLSQTPWTTLLAQTAVVTNPTAPGLVFTNESFTTQLCLDNTTVGTTGYQPGIQLVLPAGSSLTGLTYAAAGTPATYTQLGVGAATLTNPATLQSVVLTAGQTLYNLSYPLGSVPEAMAPQCLNLNIAVGPAPNPPLGVAQTLQATGYYQYGNNPAGGPAIVGSAVNVNFTPSVMRLSKAIIAPENETAAGPNYCRQITVTANIANGQTLTNLSLSDSLPTDLQLCATPNISMSGCAGTVSTPASDTATVSTPGGVVARSCSTVTGSAGSTDLVLSFLAFVPNNVVTPAAPSKLISNTANASGTYSSSTQTASATATVTAKLATLRKTVSISNDVAPTGASPGDTLRYDVVIELSDYNDLSAMQLLDNLQDGQTFNGCATATFSVTENSNSISNQSLGSDCTAGVKNSGTGVTQVSFNLANAMNALNPAIGAVLNGDLSGNSTNNGPSRVSLSYFSTIDNAYVSMIAARAPISLYDNIDNTATLSGTSSGNPITDGTSTRVTVTGVGLVKDIFQVNGLSFNPVSQRIKPGDLVTYRISTPLPLASYENFKLEDFVPIPVFAVGGFATAFSTCAAGTAPPVNTWCPGVNDDFTVATASATQDSPSVSINTIANTITWDYGDFNPPTPIANRTIELLFTLQAENVPMASDLNIANLVVATLDNTTATSQTS
ncbi:MAG: hypothetical protein RLZZ502_253, partial [Pseudomonadota bacterium]